MSWVCEFAQDAQEDLKKLTRNIQERIAHVLNQLKTDPFQGNVKASRVTIGMELFAGASVLIESYLLLAETNR
jgi:mRNA-degrading endonuclease RelE of RelBE toxin-antitoxin system